MCDLHQARSQPARWGRGSELGWVEHQAHPPPPLGHCPRDVINLKNAPTIGKHPPLGHSQAPPPPLDIARVTSSTYSKGGTKLLKGGTKSLGWATGGGVGSDPPPPLATGLYMHPQEHPPWVVVTFGCYTFIKD